MDTIVVAVDESPGAAVALRWAAKEREVHDCELIAVLCWTYLEQHHSEPGQPFDAEYGDRQAGEALAAIVERQLGDAAQHVTRRTVNDRTSRGLLEASSDANADLLVLGARGLGESRGLFNKLLGSVTRQALHHATIPVAIVRWKESDSDPLENPHGRVVVGVDGSETAARALEWALAEARLRPATLVAVHAWEAPYVGAEIAPAMAYDVVEYQRGAREVIDAAVDSADTSGLSAPVERVVATGGAGPALLDTAADADLLVVGSRGYGGFKGLLLGSTSHHVTHHAPCPVVVIPHAERAG
jgi:nucleotide-binding universal stress UspA family protein